MSSRSARKIIILLLRFLGVDAILALAFLVMPFSWIQELHLWFGLGEMPSAAIVVYLTRSLCLFYGVFGLILFYISFDIDHYRKLLGVFGFLFVIIGIAALCIAVFEGLPLSWLWTQGPFMVLFGLSFIWILRIMNNED